MSDEKRERPRFKLPDVKKDNKDMKKRGLRVVRWFREMKSELKKVVWPTRKQIINNTIVVLVIMISASIVVWCIDQAGVYIVNTLLLLGGK